MLNLFKPRLCVLAAAIMLASGVCSSAEKVAGTLGTGLDILVVEEMAKRDGAAKLRAVQNPLIRPAANTDENGRVQVIVYLNGRMPLADVEAMIDASGGEVIAKTSTYRAGAIEAWMPVMASNQLAMKKGISSVVLSGVARTNVGAAVSQGVELHRINKLPANVDGRGVTIGVLSDSYNTSGGPITAETDIASGDLPGVGNPNGNTTPVTVIEDFSGGSDEGRGMLQIIHDMAPKAKLGYATAFTGEIAFANNIRALAGLPDAVGSRPDFKADVIVDDIGYLTAPYFSDGIVSQAVDEVASKGVAYFSSAGNSSGSEQFQSAFNFVPADSPIIASSGLNFANVPKELYAGGVHNFGSSTKPDIGQSVDVNFGRVGLQWDDAYDDFPELIRELFTSSGELVDATSSVDFKFNVSADQAININVEGTDNPELDVIIELIDPSGESLFVQDTVFPENAGLLLDTAGEYTVRVTGFEGAIGKFSVEVNETDAKPGITTDLNLLIFGVDGEFLGQLATNNFLFNQPIEFAGIAVGEAQFVIARTTVPTAKNAATRFRYDLFGSAFFGSGRVIEYANVNEPAIFGHKAARGAIAVAAFPFFGPSIPEDFSQGPVDIYFDKNLNRLSKPERRIKPEISAMDGANTTFFGSDVPQDVDTLPNFFGTSASAPHAAAIAALVIQAAGGPGKISPRGIRNTLIASARGANDVDPYKAEALLFGRGGLVRIRANDDSAGINSIIGATFKVENYGFSPMKSLIFNPNGNIAESGATTTPVGTFPEGTASAGLVWDVQQVGSPFAVSDLMGLAAENITAKGVNQAPPPAIVDKHFFTYQLDFTAGSFRFGESFKFGTDTDLLDAVGPAGSAFGNSADLLGAGYSIQQGRLLDGGMRVKAVFENGRTAEGIFRNRLFPSFSPLSGYGFIDAQRAVTLALIGRGRED